MGYDDNSATHLSGARAALPIWSRFAAAVRPAHGYPAFAVPAGMVTATVDSSTGQLATPFCPQRVNEIFPEWQAPTEPCQLHSPSFAAETRADLTLDEPGIDPVTGEINLAATEDPRYAVTDHGLQIVDPGGDGTIVIRPSTFRPSTGPPPAPEPPPVLATPPGPRADRRARGRDSFAHPALRPGYLRPLRRPRVEYLPIPSRLDRVRSKGAEGG